MRKTGALLFLERFAAQAALRHLVRLSLVECDGQGQPFAHRLILGFVRHLGGAVSNWTGTVAAVGKEWGVAHDVGDIASLIDLEVVLPHAVAILAREDLPLKRAAEMAYEIAEH